MIEPESMSENCPTVFKYMAMITPEKLQCVNFPEFAELLDNVEQIQLGSINFPTFNMALMDAMEQIDLLFTKVVNPESFVTLVQVNPLFKTYNDTIVENLPKFGNVITPEMAKLISADFPYAAGEILRVWMFDYVDMAVSDSGNYLGLMDSKDAGACIRLYTANGIPARTIH